jgi:hypothetical protein
LRRRRLSVAKPDRQPERIADNRFIAFADG